MLGQVELPVSPQLLAMMPVIVAIVFALGKISFIEKNKGFLLPVLAVVVAVGASFLTGQTDPVLSGIGLGAATCYTYDLGKGVLRAIKPAQQ